MTELASAWRDVSLNGPPYGLAEDLRALERHPSCHVTMTYDQYLLDGLGNPDDRRLHLGLLPQPWFGDLSSADIFILMLNPGLNPGDYFAEYRVPELRAALVQNLKQERREFPLLWLDPQFSWHPGATYFRDRLEWIAKGLVEKNVCSYRDGLAEVAKRVCILQLVPYHSISYGLPGRVRLRSTDLVRRFVGEDLSCRSGISLLVTRAVKRWNIRDATNILSYSGSECRSARTSRDTRGGELLARAFGI